MAGIERNSYFDGLRGIAILMVLGIHTCSIEDGSYRSHIIEIAIRQLLNCAVPIFMAISGYFCGKKCMDCRSAIIVFWKKQIPKIYIPYLICSSPFFLASVISDGSIFKNLLLWGMCGYAIFYFIIVIIQCYLLLPLIVNNRGLGGAISVVLSMISIWYIAYSGFNHYPSIYYAGPVTTWIMFFSLGVVLGNKKRNYSILIPLLLVTFGYVGELLETFYLNLKYGGGLGIKPTSFMFSTGMILLLFQSKIEHIYHHTNIRNLDYIASIGRDSYCIYLIHYYISTTSKLILSGSWFLRWSFVLITSLVIIIALKAMFPPRFLKMIGLQ